LGGTLGNGEGKTQEHPWGKKKCPHPGTRIIQRKERVVKKGGQGSITVVKSIRTENPFGGPKKDTNRPAYSAMSYHLGARKKAAFPATVISRSLAKTTYIMTMKGAGLKEKTKGRGFTTKEKSAA